MKVQIRARDVTLTDAMRAHVEHRLGLVLGRFVGRIGPVTVQFSEQEGGKHCHIDVALRPQKLLAQDTGTDLLAAFDYASDRVASSVARALERQLDRSSTWPPRAPGGPKP